MDSDNVDRTWVQIGDFYSPVVDSEDIDYLKLARSEVTDLDLDSESMWRLYEDLVRVSKPSEIEVTAAVRESDQFGLSDQIIYDRMIGVLKPRRIVEVGAGASTLVAWRAIRHFGLATRLTSIDPFPTREVFREMAAVGIELIQSPVQDVNDEYLFASLETGDLLFVDSSHVAKTGSDVLDIFFRIMPLLQPGVVVHFHDIFFPFEYPFEWVKVDNRSWNELYFLRAWLTNNSRAKVIFFSDYLWALDEQRFRAGLGVEGKRAHRPGSIYLEIV